MVLLGGGHTHVMVLAAARRLHAAGAEVTVVSPSVFQYYSGMGPGLLGGMYTREHSRFNLPRLTAPAGVRFIRAEATCIDPVRRIVHLGAGAGSECFGSGPLHYDLLSCNTGSSVKDELLTPAARAELGRSVFTAKPIRSLLSARIALLRGLRRARHSGEPLRVAVIGGGAGGVELAGNILRLAAAAGAGGVRAEAAHRGTNARDSALELTLFHRGRLLPALPPAARAAALRSLTARGAAVREHVEVAAIAPGRIGFSNGSQHPVHLVVLATGTRPSELLARSDLAHDGRGAMRVNRYLQSVTAPEIFGSGDCISFDPAPLDAVGVYAVRQSATVTHNLLAMLTNTRMHRFRRAGAYLAGINLGDDTAILSKWGIAMHNRTALRIKEHYDIGFVTRFAGGGTPSAAEQP